MRIRVSFWKSVPTPNRPVSVHELVDMLWVESKVEKDAIETAQQWFEKKKDVKNWKQAADLMTTAPFDEDANGQS